MRILEGIIRCTRGRGKLWSYHRPLMYNRWQLTTIIELRWWRLLKYWWIVLNGWWWTTYGKSLITYYRGGWAIMMPYWRWMVWIILWRCISQKGSSLLWKCYCRPDWWRRYRIWRRWY